jgi:hypothetical protein
MALAHTNRRRNVRPSAALPTMAARAVPGTMPVRWVQLLPPDRTRFAAPSVLLWVVER